jgi:hypothetical protein
MHKYFFNILIAFDQLLNTFFAGWPDETISSRLFRLEQDRKFIGEVFRPVVDYIAFLCGESNHSQNAFLSERCDRQQPPENREK